jgi:nucleotide-binding universal stress UspA family protein
MKGGGSQDHAMVQFLVPGHFFAAPECTGLNVGGTALIAWDGSDQANGALRAAVQMLQLAQTVSLLQVNTPHRGCAVEDAENYLGCHGIKAHFLNRATEGPVADLIVAHAENEDAAYIVMGAYGTNRRVEAMLGGTTRGVLLMSHLPLVLAHYIALRPGTACSCMTQLERTRSL